MPGIDKASGRGTALIMLLVLAGASLRGYLPAAGPPSHRQTTESPATLAPMVVLLVVSLGIVAVAFINRVRNRRPVPGNLAALSTGRGSGGGRPSWRVLLIGLAVISAWLLLIWLLARLVGQHDLDGVGPEHIDAPAAATAPPPTGAAPQREIPQRNPGGHVFGYLAATAAAMLLLIVAGVVVTARARRNGPKASGRADERPVATAAASGPVSLARAAELGLAEIGALGREPREAIISCYATMERELAHVPEAVPQVFDTPTEVLARAVEHHALLSEHATALVDLFAEARFSPHLMTERHRRDAVRMLRLVLAELPDTA